MSTGTPSSSDTVKYVLGKDAVVVCDGTTMDNVQDVTLTLSKGEADVTTRGNEGWRATVGTLKECSAEWTMLHLPGDACYASIMDSYLNDTLLPMSFLTETNGEGPVGLWSITNVSREEPLEDAIKVSVTAKMAKFTEWK